MRRPQVARIVVCGWVGLLAGPAHGDTPKPEDLAFFEAKIRPVLVTHCYACHSAEAVANNKLKGGLRLDSREAMLQGGDSGPAIVPGHAAESLLIEALRYDDFLKMPPKGKLPDSVIADFTRWIDRGAPDPRRPEQADSRKPTAGIDVATGRTFWAYRPARRAEVPAVLDNAWPLSAIDRFLLAKIEEAGLAPAAEADRPALIRRLSFDLVGLPPTPEDIDAFVGDDAPDAYERLVDRLLASPRFGERWARHWLDVARFAESLTLRGFLLKEAWRYRDYVISAFNEDRPIDQFLREQVAGDLIPDGPSDSLEERRRRRIATTFLMLGNTNLEEQDKRQLDMDVVDEQLDTIGKAFLAQTIGCARCHDHKFDPIPTRDYYAMAGILRNARALEHANVSKWLEVPLPVPPEEAERLARHDAAVAALEARVKQAKAASLAVAGGQIAATGVIAAADLPGVVVDDARARQVGQWQKSTHSGSYVGDGYLHDQNAGKGEKTLTFPAELPEAGTYDVWLAYAHGGSRARAVPITILSADGEATVTVDMKVPPPLDGRFVSLGQYRFEANGQGYVLISNEGTDGHVTADAVMFLPVAAANARTADAAKPGTAAADRSAQLQALEAELKRLKESGPRREKVMTVVEDRPITDAKIHIRGSVHTLGETVPRGVLQVATVGEPPVMPTHQSGRLELAEWIASADNPLTARVFVNRVWHWLFGAGLVRTTDNFGTTGEPPSHPELLDALALRFVEDGWSLKALVRQLVLSRAYRQSSAASPLAVAADPENRLLSHANRPRLEAECLRDAMLAVAGTLDSTPGGPNYPADLKDDYHYARDDTRRSVYAPVFRNALPALFEAFDFPDPSLVVGRRNVSTVAPQALLLMNHPFVREQARAAARRLLARTELAPDGRVALAYRLALGREPTAAERVVAREFLEAGGVEPAEDRWTTFVQALFSSIAFRYME